MPAKKTKEDYSEVFTKTVTVTFLDGTTKKMTANALGAFMDKKLAKDGDSVLFNATYDHGRITKIVFKKENK